MKRVLLLIPTTSYRTQSFLTAARELGVEVTVGSERPNVMADRNPEGLLTLKYQEPKEAARKVIQFSHSYPLDAIVGVDDQGAVLAATIAEALSLPHNSVASVAAAQNKHTMRGLLNIAGVPQPKYRLISLDEDPSEISNEVPYPCVVKPLTLAGSRGVIRADSDVEFRAALDRLKGILRMPDVASMRGDSSSRHVLVESFVPGKEVALEGLISHGKLKVLAIFDKPDPLDGPYFEETIYVTPSRLSHTLQEEIILCAARAAEALGLERGPVHAELRINQTGPCVIEIAARSIGGFCSIALRFGNTKFYTKTVSLEELLLRDALEMDTTSFRREPQAAGVMMIPIPDAGVFYQVKGVQEAKMVEHIEDVIISAHLNETLVPLPEGGKYLGFIFSRAGSPEHVETALREAHARLEFVIH